MKKLIALSIAAILLIGGCSIRDSDEQVSSATRNFELHHASVEGYCDINLIDNKNMSPTEIEKAENKVRPKVEKYCAITFLEKISTLTRETVRAGYAPDMYERLASNAKNAEIELNECAKNFGVTAEYWYTTSEGDSFRLPAFLERSKYLSDRQAEALRRTKN